MHSPSLLRLFSFVFHCRSFRVILKELLCGVAIDVVVHDDDVDVMMDDILYEVMTSKRRK